LFSQQKTIIRPTPIYGRSEYLLQCESLNCYFFITRKSDVYNTQPHGQFNVLVGSNYHWNRLEIETITHYHNIAATLITFNPNNAYQSIYITQPLNTIFFSRLILTNNQCLLLTLLSPSLEGYRNLGIRYEYLPSTVITATPLTLTYDTFVNGLNTYIAKRGIKLFDWVAKCTLFGHGLIYLSGITHTFPQTCLIEIKKNSPNYFFVHFHSTCTHLIEAKKIAAFLNNGFGKDFCEYTPQFNTNTNRTLCFSLDSIKKHWDPIVNGLDQSLTHLNKIKKAASQNYTFFSRNHAPVLPSAACSLDSSTIAATEMTGSSSKHFKLK
jgi:hypothetical protein